MAQLLAKTSTMAGPLKNQTYQEPGEELTPLSHQQRQLQSSSASHMLGYERTANESFRRLERLSERQRKAIALGKDHHLGAAHLFSWRATMLPKITQSALTWLPLGLFTAVRLAVALGDLNPAEDLPVHNIMRVLHHASSALYVQRHTCAASREQRLACTTTLV